MKHKFLSLGFGIAAICCAALPSNAAVVLADDFTGVIKADTTATIAAWDTVNGIAAPSTSLTFFNANDTPAAADDGGALGFHNVTGNQIDVNQNMTAGGWRTSIDLLLEPGTASIDLTELTLDMRLTNGSGSDNTTGSKSGRMTVELVGSVSGVLGTIDPGNLGYPTVDYTRILDLSSLPTLNSSETYTLNISALGTGFGHHKSLRALTLEGSITAIPEPSTALLSGLGLLSLLLRRRR